MAPGHQQPRPSRLSAGPGLFVRGAAPPGLVMANLLEGGATIRWACEVISSHELGLPGSGRAFFSVTQTDRPLTEKITVSAAIAFALLIFAAFVIIVRTHVARRHFRPLTVRSAAHAHEARRATGMEGGSAEWGRRHDIPYILAGIAVVNFLIRYATKRGVRATSTRRFGIGFAICGPTK